MKNNNNLKNSMSGNKTIVLNLKRLTNIENRRQSELRKKQSILAIQLMHRRMIIETVTDPVERITKLAAWKIDASRYWDRFIRGVNQ